MKTLKLFNSVLAKPSKEQVYVSEHGYVIPSEALWTKTAIEKYFSKEKLDGYGLNKTFHKSWRRILSSDPGTLRMEQIRHYISTYGSNFQDEIYIPKEVVDVPQKKLVYKVIQALSKEVLTTKCLAMLQSGMALSDETINDLLSVLVDELSYTFTGEENIKNKEAMVKLADMYGVLPSDTLSFFRIVIYKVTGEALLIKSPEVIGAITASNYNPAVLFNKFGLEKLAEIFNRFKPLFLAFKSKCPTTINKISKLSKVHHKPMVQNPLNFVTSIILTDADRHWLGNATIFSLFKALSACYTRMHGQYAFAYRVRNGKSYIKNRKVSGAVWPNYDFLMGYLKERYNLSGKKFYFPKDVSFALPTSEKMYVGHIPTGTKFYGDKLAVGVYWKKSICTLEMA